MCRFIFYLGAPIRLSTIISEPSHSLLVQSLHASCQTISLNADGFGIGWYEIPSVIGQQTPIQSIPATFKDCSPAWSNVNLKQLARVTRSGCILAHIRASSGSSIVNTNCHPFTHKNISWMHNGMIPYFNFLKREMFSIISDSAIELIKGTTDSELLFALFITNYEKEIEYKNEKKKLNTGVTYSTQNCYPEPEEIPYPSYVDNTEVIPRVLFNTMLQMHRMVLEYEINNGILPADTLTNPMVINSDDGADLKQSLPQTSACCKLNLAVTNGSTVVATRYVTGCVETAHSLYWSRASTIKFDHGHCQLGRSTDSSPQSKAYCESLVISSEPLATDFQCEVVPVNHAVIGNSSGYFSIERIQ